MYWIVVADTSGGIEMPAERIGLAMVGKGFLTGMTIGIDLDLDVFEFHSLLTEGFMQLRQVLFQNFLNLLVLGQQLGPQLILFHGEGQLYFTKFFGVHPDDDSTLVSSALDSDAVHHLINDLVFTHKLSRSQAYATWFY